MSYGVVITQVGILFALIAVGYIAGITKVVKTSASADLTNLLMKIALPATIFASLARTYDTTLLKDGLLCFVIGMGFFMLAMGVSLVAAKIMKVPDGKKGIWTIASSFSNTGFVGFPVASALFGADGLFMASLFNLSFNILVFSFGVVLASKDSEIKGEISLKKILVSNINIAMFIGLIFFVTQIAVPGPIMTLVNYFGALTTPLSMFIIGLNLTTGKPRELFTDKDAISASFMRLILMPLLAFVIMSILPFREGSIVPGLVTAIIAMPAPSICMIFAQQYKCDIDFAGKVIFLSSLACLVTIPLILLLV